MNVFDRLFKLFKAPPAPREIKPLPEADVPHALGALLVRVALSDKQYAVQEISQIDRVLAAYQGIGPIAAAKLRAECERLEAFAPDTPDFAFLLCKSVSYAERLSMIEALWQVVFADGALKDVESDVMELTQNQLGIAPEDCAAAKAKAQTTAHLSTFK
ncbi:TerB family tellurite resistance protein [Planktotalea arctica]|uniref:tellurite resistance TerB family protein n=1 Tax=Planktotalea arctica TaxID=1481893 RepID=UPI00321B5DC9